MSVAGVEGENTAIKVETSPNDQKTFKHFLRQILITLLGEEGAGLCAYRAFVCSYAHVNLRHFFSSS